MLKRTLLLLIFLCATTPVVAQQATPAKSKTTGFMLGLGVNGTSIKFDDDDEGDSGAGGSLIVGYGFSPRIAGFVDLSGVVLDGDPGEGEVTLAQVFVGARFHFRAGQRVVPFLNLGLGARGLGQDDATVCFSTNPCEVSLSGAAFLFGGGVSFYATRKLALTGALDFGTGEFSSYTENNVTISGLEADATTTRVNLGVTWFPGR